MAYMNQEKKAVISAALKKALAGTGLKYSLKVRSHMAIDLTIKSGPIDFISDFNHTVRNHPDYQRRNLSAGSLSINQYHYKDQFSPAVQVVIRDIVNAMYSADYYDRSDIMTDYFDCAYYMSIQVGAWDKPYTLTK